MPFSKFVIDPQHEAMRKAFYTVCDALMLNGEVDDPITELLTELIVERMVALAKAGEHDADRLAELVLRDFMDDDRPGPSEGLGASGPSSRV
jgi:hypothetical protein